MTLCGFVWLAQIRYVLVFEVKSVKSELEEGFLAFFHILLLG